MTAGLAGKVMVVKHGRNKGFTFSLHSEEFCHVGGDRTLNESFHLHGVVRGNSKRCKNVALGLEVRVDIETEVEGQTEKWQSKNSSQRLWAVERGDKNEGMKEGLRVVKCKQRQESQRSDRSTSEGGGRDKLKKSCR